MPVKKVAATNQGGAKAQTKKVAQSQKRTTQVKQTCKRVEKPKAKIATPKVEKLTAKQRALKLREQKFKAAQQVYLTKNYVAVVTPKDRSYYAKNDENLAIARKVMQAKQNRKRA